MALLQRIVRFLKHLDNRELYQLIGGILLATMLFLGFFFYRYYRAVHLLQGKLRRINTYRTEAQEILTTYEQVIHQQQKVDEILKRDPNFKLKQFFDDTLKRLRLSDHLDKEPETSQATLVSGYTEIKMDTRLKHITMQQLVELLQALEQSERVYVKELKISSVSSKKLLDVALAVATFEKEQT